MIAAESPKPRDPGKRPLNHPAPGKDTKVEYFPWLAFFLALLECIPIGFGDGEYLDGLHPPMHVHQDP
jgi:hypothetical protein